MFNALAGMGGGGQLDPTAASNGNVALYTCFSVGGFFSGAVVNKLGPTYSMALGAITYGLYSASLLYYNHKESESFVVAAGAILGFGAALLWTGQGAIMLSYPKESNKGKSISIFWMIFNLGGVVGSIIPLSLNWLAESKSVNDGTYIGFIVLMTSGAILALCLLPPSKVYHNDGSFVVIQKYPKWNTELLNVLKLFLNPDMLLLTPMFIASNWFYAYQFNDVNAFYFNIRTRALNNLFYWLAQIIGAIIIGGFLDFDKLTRKGRAIFGLAILSIIIFVTWLGGLFNQLGYDRQGRLPRDNSGVDETIGLSGDLFDDGYAQRVILYIAYGLCDAMFQCYTYWMIGALTNDSSVLARYIGYYKAIQSAGGAISWRIDAVKTSFLVEFLICWALLIASIPGAFFVSLRIKDTNYTEGNPNNNEKDDAKKNNGDTTV
ncbi:3242_t:CDS:2 [Entrophospora sp. SA101]|nr:3242_t:CDS:2 [Entrophospora sp. SA101]